MSTLTTVILLILLDKFEIVKAGTAVDGYSGEVDALFKDLKSYKNIVSKAKAKMNEFDETWDRKYAIAIINLYTQQSSFYITLNSEMRNKFPDNTTDIWRRAGDLINRGLDILGPTVHKLLYRGCGVLKVRPVAGEDYIFNQITSTTPVKANAIAFIPCENGILFQITNVYGVSVADYSHFSFEREVIIKSYNVFKVTKGPIKEKGYNICYLDGQSEFNRENPSNRNDNGAYRTRADILLHCAVAVVVYLIVCQE